MRQNSRKALIIGGGIAGPTTAIFLKQAGIDAEVFEAWPYATGIGGGLQIAPNGMHVLSEMGLADELVRRGSIAESFDFHSQSGARLGSVNQNMQARFGQPAVNMCRATLNEVLAKGAAQFSFSSPQPDFSGHQLCTPQPYVQGLDAAAPFHPTVLGQLAIALTDQAAVHPGA